MTMREQPSEPKSDLDQEGIPDMEGAYPGEAATGTTSEGVMPPGDEPKGVEEYGVTAAQQAQDEPVALRAWREEPEVGAGDPAGVEAPDRLVAPDQGMVAHDDEGAMVGTDAVNDTGARSGEESAMRVTDDAPGGTFDESPEYVGDELPGGGAGEPPQS
jgi:hypothetical protein